MRLYKHATAAKKLQVSLTELSERIESGEFETVTVDGEELLNAEQIDALVSPPKKRDVIGWSSMDKWGKALSVLAAGLLGVFIILNLVDDATSAFTPRATSTPRPDVGEPSGAYINCKNAVEQVLPAPSTAEFARYDPDDVTQLSGNTWMIISYVDSQNAFGAMLRSDYACEIRYVGNHQWRLIDLDID